jgi:hypothetical protein
MRLTPVNRVHTRITGNECRESSHLKAFTNMIK